MLISSFFFPFLNVWWMRSLVPQICLTYTILRKWFWLLPFGLEETLYENSIIETTADKSFNKIYAEKGLIPAQQIENFLFRDKAKEYFGINESSNRLNFIFTLRKCRVGSFFIFFFKWFITLQCLTVVQFFIDSMNFLLNCLSHQKYLSVEKEAKLKQNI